MEFLESLYSIENFGIYLFVVIGVLVVAFLVILFFGKKDEIKRKEEEKDVEVSDGFHETTEPVSLEVPEASLDYNAMSEGNVVNYSLPILDDERISTGPVVDEIVPVVEKEFDFDALAAAISKELESIENNEHEEVIAEPKMVEPVVMDSVDFSQVEDEPIEPVLSKVEEAPMNYQVFEPVREDLFSDIMMDIEEPILEDHIDVPVEPVLFPSEPEPIIPIIEEPEEPKKFPRPAVFSSVYVNRNVEEPKIMEEQRVISPETPENDMATPVAPKIELPKMMDLPKKK